MPEFTVQVDDNFHYGDESERYSAGSFDSMEEAIKKCEEIVVRSLKEFYKDGITADQLKAQWLMFGDDPFVVGPAEGVPYSARDFIDIKLCKKVIEECRRENL